MKLGLVVLYTVGGVATVSVASSPFVFPVVMKWFSKSEKNIVKTPTEFKTLCVADDSAEQGETKWKNGDIDCSLYDRWEYSIP